MPSKAKKHPDTARLEALMRWIRWAYPTADHWTRQMIDRQLREEGRRDR